MIDALTVKWVTKLVVGIAASTPVLVKATKIKKNGEWAEYKPLIDECIYKWFVPLMKMGNIEIIVKGYENIPKNEPVIYTPNHSGKLDFSTICLTAPTPPTFMAKKELKKLPIVKNWMNVMDCVFVDRNNKKKAGSSLHEAIEMVGKGKRSIVVFPEGTRSKTGELGKFKGGAMKIAMETGAKIVPVLIEGTRERFDMHNRIVPGLISVSYLPAINTKGLSKEEFFAMPERIREMLLEEREKIKSEILNASKFKKLELDALSV
ncbi:MAG: lysophospholipid acyltransferase family protein [Acutalibacteraceae bacterium]